MSGISRSSVGALPDTGAIINSVIAQGAATTIAGPSTTGVTWKVIGVSITGPGLGGDAANLTMNLINTANSNKVVIMPSTAFDAAGQAPIEISKYIAGDLLLDSKTKLELVESADAGGHTAQIAYIVVN